VYTKNVALGAHCVYKKRDFRRTLCIKTYANLGSLYVYLTYGTLRTFCVYKTYRDFRNTVFIRHIEALGTLCVYKTYRDFRNTLYI